jgi:hypothetical protein
VRGWRSRHGGWRWARVGHGRLSGARIDVAVPVETTVSVCELRSTEEQVWCRSRWMPTAELRNGKHGHVPYRSS